MNQQDPESIIRRMTVLTWPFLMAVSALCLTLHQETSLAQTGTVTLVCRGWTSTSKQFTPGPTYAMVLAINYDARTMAIEEMDPGGNTSRGAFGSPPGATTQLLEDRIITRFQWNDRSFQEYTFNRYSAVLNFSVFWAQNDLLASAYSGVCQPYQRGPRQY